LRGRPGDDVCTDAPLYSWTIERPLADLIQRVKAYGNARSSKALAQITTIRSIEIDSRNTHGRPRTFRLRADRGREIELSAEELRRAVDSALEGDVAPEKPLWSSNVEMTIARRTVRFEGRGHGHGVGLCQHGAEALARAGEEYKSILAWYYPGAALARAYD
jgi:stage II sporulation protein D